MRFKPLLFPLHPLKRETRQKTGEKPHVWDLQCSQVPASTQVGAWHRMSSPVWDTYSPGTRGSQLPIAPSVPHYYPFPKDSMWVRKGGGGGELRVLAGHSPSRYFSRLLKGQFPYAFPQPRAGLAPSLTQCLLELY